jgi:hypothetical protein
MAETQSTYEKSVEEKMQEGYYAKPPSLIETIDKLEAEKNAPNPSVPAGTNPPILQNARSGNMLGSIRIPGPSENKPEETIVSSPSTGHGAGLGPKYKSPEDEAKESAGAMLTALGLNPEEAQAWVTRYPSLTPEQLSAKIRESYTNAPPPPKAPTTAELYNSSQAGVETGTSSASSVTQKSAIDTRPDYLKEQRAAEATTNIKSQAELDKEALDAAQAYQDERAKRLLEEKTKSYNETQAKLDLLKQQKDQAEKESKEASEAEVDPRRLFKQKGTFGSIMLALSSGLESFGRALQGNFGPTTVDQMIDNDIRQQELEIARKGKKADNRLAQLQIELDSKDRAAEQLKIEQSTALFNKLQQDHEKETNPLKKKQIELNMQKASQEVQNALDAAKYPMVENSATKNTAYAIRYGSDAGKVGKGIIQAREQKAQGTQDGYTSSTSSTSSVNQPQQTQQTQQPQQPQQMNPVEEINNEYNKNVSRIDEEVKAGKITPQEGEIQKAGYKAASEAALNSADLNKSLSGIQEPTLDPIARSKAREQKDQELIDNASKGTLTEIQTFKENLSRLGEDYASGKLSKDQYEEGVRSIKSNISRLTSELDKSVSEAKKITSLPGKDRIAYETAKAQDAAQKAKLDLSVQEAQDTAGVIRGELSAKDKAKRDLERENATKEINKNLGLEIIRIRGTYADPKPVKVQTKIQPKETKPAEGNKNNPPPPKPSDNKPAFRLIPRTQKELDKDREEEAKRETELRKGVSDEKQKEIFNTLEASRDLKYALSLNGIKQKDGKVISIGEVPGTTIGEKIARLGEWLSLGTVTLTDASASMLKTTINKIIKAEAKQTFGVLTADELANATTDAGAGNPQGMLRFLASADGKFDRRIGTYHADPGARLYVQDWNKTFNK